VVYLLLIPYTGYRYRWLARHPEAWGVPVRERRAVARAARSARRLGLRSPLRRRVAGRASAMAAAVRRFGDDPTGAIQRGRAGNGRTGNGRAPGPAPLPPRSRLRLGLRRARRR
jgi:CDP-diacylglycerol--serine O-phosphatidyltransferase